MSARFIRRLFFINVIALVIIYSVFSNPQVTNAQVFLEASMLVGTSETVRMFSTCLCSKVNEHNKGNGEEKDLKIRQWIAGLIDGQYLKKMIFYTN